MELARRRHADRATAGWAARRRDQRFVALLTGCHMAGDVNQGAVGPLIALLVTTTHLSYASAGELVLGTTIASAVAQPLVGYATDRFRAIWLLPLGIALAGLGISVIGLTTSYWVIFTGFLVSGLGTAGYHPVGARLIAHVTQLGRASSMSVFSVGGALGLALGPLVISAAIAVSGPHGTVWLAVLALVVAAAVVSTLPALARWSSGDAAAVLRAGVAAVDSWGSFTRLAVAVIGRSVAFFGLTVYIPLYWIQQLGASHLAAGLALTVLLLCGVVGALAGGRFADRFGRKRVTCVALLILMVAVAALAADPGRLPAIALLLPLGIGLYAPHSVMVVMGQELLPEHPGIASGVTLGLAVSAGGIAAPLIGRVADAHGLSGAFLTIAVVVAVAIAFALTLPAGSGTTVALQPAVAEPHGG